MKQLIKALVPKSLFKSAVDLRNLSRLLATPRLNFQAAHLRTSVEISLENIFSDPNTQGAWIDDSEAIASLFGSNTRLGEVNPGDRQALYFLIKALNPQSVLEIGTYVGASTLHIVRALAAEAKLTTVDIEDVNAPLAPWFQAGFKMNPKTFAQKLGCSEKIRFVTSTSLEFFSETKEKYDFIFLDGDHSADTVYREVSAALKILNPEGSILLHDYYPGSKPLFSDKQVKRGPVRALMRIQKENPAIGVLPLGELPWPTKLGSKATSLALVVRNPKWQ